MQPIKILRLPAVEAATGLKKSSLYEMIALGQFPRQIALTKRAVGWDEAAVQAWLEARAKTPVAA